MEGDFVMGAKENNGIPNLRENIIETKDDRYLEGDGEKEVIHRRVENPGKEYEGHAGDQYEGNPADEYKTNVADEYKDANIDEQYPDNVQISMKDRIDSINHNK